MRGAVRRRARPAIVRVASATGLRGRACSTRVDLAPRRPLSPSQTGRRRWPPQRPSGDVSVVVEREAGARPGRRSAAASRPPCPRCGEIGSQRGARATAIVTVEPIGRACARARGGRRGSCPARRSASARSSIDGREAGVPERVRGVVDVEVARARARVASAGRSRRRAATRAGRLTLVPAGGSVSTACQAGSPSTARSGASA